MSASLTPREKELALKASALRASSERPAIVGGGMLGDILNFTYAHVPIWIVRSALIIFIAYHAWVYAAKARQMAAEVVATNREAVRQETEAEAMRQKLGVGNVAMATVIAELEKIQAERAKADAEVQAQGHIQDGATARLRSLKADIAKAQADLANAEVDFKAKQTQVNKVPAIVVQKRAELSQLESAVQSKIGALRFIAQAEFGR